MISVQRLAALFAPLFVAFAIGPAAAQPIEVLAAFDRVEHFRLDSRSVGRPFEIFVRLPSSYDTSDAVHPTVYLLDGDVTFPLLAGFAPLLGNDEPVIPEPIIVGIAYGAFDAGGGNYRSVDYTTPTAGGQGGADKFQTFLKEELLPKIELDYRSNPARRILIGQSRGGHFVLYSAFTAPDLFWARIASNPAQWPSQSFFLSDPGLKPATDTALYVSSGEFDRADLRRDALAWAKSWRKRKDKPWRLKFESAEGATHAADYLNVYRSGMRWIFDAPAPGRPPNQDRR